MRRYKELDNTKDCPKRGHPNSRNTKYDDTVFSEEKILTVEPKFNPKNDRVLGEHSEDVP